MASIRRRGNKWQARIQRRGHREVLKTFTARSDAERWARGVERDLDLGAYRPRSTGTSIPLKALLIRYSTEVSPQKRGGTMEAIRLKAMAARPIGEHPVGALTAIEIARYRDQRLGTVSGSTVNRDLDDLSAVLGHAQREWGICVSNEVKNVRRPRKAPPRNRVLSAAEEELLLHALDPKPRTPLGEFTSDCRNAWLKPIVQLAIFTAMRRSELLSLMWGDIDLDRRTANLAITKNGDRRTVPLSTSAVTLLRGLAPSRCGRLFPVSANAVQKAFSRAAARAGLADFRFHDLRHTATTRLSQSLPNLIELAAVTGHRDLKMLQRYYHPDPEALAHKIG